MTRLADQTHLNTYGSVMEVGGGTTVDTIAHIAAANRIAPKVRAGTASEGEQIEWEVTLKGRITIDKAIIDAAVEQLIK